MTPFDCFVGARFPTRLFKAEYRGEVLGNDTQKMRVTEARVVQEIRPVWLRRVNSFIQSISGVKFFVGHGKVSRKWKRFPARAAAGDAARAAAWAAAWDAAGDAAWDAARDAAWDAARAAAWAAARAAAGAAAWDAAGAAARDAARDAAGDAAGDAALVVRCLLVADLESFDKKHMRQAMRQWNVWREGYGRYTDVDGVFYVYEKP
jgi:hypothetical protein